MIDRMHFGGRLAMRLQTAMGRLAMRVLTTGVGDLFAKVPCHPCCGHNSIHPHLQPSTACFSVLDHDISPLHKSSRSSLHCSSGSSLHCLCMSVVDSFLLINISC